MADQPSELEGGQAGQRLGWGPRAAFAIGAVGLLGAMATDVVSVAGRHLGVPLVGSIEVVQALVVLSASGALVGSTLAGAHAAVHVLTEHLPDGPRGALARFGSLLGAALFAALAGGGGWLIADVWALDERGELLGVPIVPLRFIWLASCTLTAVLFLAEAFGRRPPEASAHDA